MVMVGLDLGFGYVKVWNGKGIKFPTLLKKKRVGYSETGSFTIEFGKEEFFVGEDALKHGGATIPIVTVEDLIKYSPVFLKYLKERKGIVPKSVATGLPPDYMTEENVKEFKRKIAQTLSIPEKSVGVFPQGSGILIDVMEELSDAEKIFVLDIGFNTIDYLLGVKEGEGFGIEVAGTLPEMGIIYPVRKLRDILSKDMPILKALFTPQDFIKVFEKGKIKVQGKEYDVSDIVKQIKEEYVEEIRMRLEDYKEMLIDADYLVIGGGGANVIERGYFSSLHSGEFVPEQPEFSQARGYYKALKITEGE